MSNNRFFLAVLASSLFAFFGGWLVFGFLFMDYYSSNTNEAAKILMKDEPVMWAIALSNIAWALLITWVLRKTGSTGFYRGFMTSLWVSFLLITVFNISMYGLWDIYEIRFLIVDIIGTSLFWGVVGGVSGVVLGMSKKAVPTATHSS